MNNNIKITTDNGSGSLFDKIVSLIEQARARVATAVNTAEVYTKFHIGQFIIENEQGGLERAAYGKAVLKDLSLKLTKRFGNGWSVENLTLFRKFYLTYSSHNSGEAKIVNTVCEIEKVEKDTPCLPNSTIVGSTIDTAPSFLLSWSHYLVLMRIKDEKARSFYEIECAQQNWSVRQLQRQYNSSLYERLALSRNKDEVMRLATEGQTIEKSADVIKNPLSLEFLGLKPDESYSESKLEGAIISRMKDFLLEMGKGFLFEARQKRFTFEEEFFYVDLVLYNRLLQCYCLIDFKIDKLTHQDLGQMQMYVNYFDRYVKQAFEKPTIGILICREKKDALVELTLPKNANIYATEYQLYLPDKQLLESKLKEWIDEYEDDDKVTE
ncbi:PDDEXK nuclease domain-containing protein [Hoylesella pleuritidis]|jgi:hypothetical protein|uniref:PDDEXK nuclease domain-containing protein n=1 Tax=Hoylesella pleuritidis TaxID=407975 RepID=UPI0028E726E2|nr:PDDEXK nuclease domain-containing protein [Hoylesella pleuritidis]